MITPWSHLKEHIEKPEVPFTLARPEEFQNGGFTLKMHQMFSVHTTPEKFENGGFTLKTH